MKKVFLFLVCALCTNFFAYAQSSASRLGIGTFSSLSYKSGDGGLSEYPIAYGFATSYDFTKNFGAILQYRSVEMWGIHNKDNGMFLMKTATAFLYASMSRDDSKHLAGPMAGGYFGFGFPITEDSRVEGNPYFGGVFIQLNYGFDIPNAHIAFFIKTEGGYAYFGSDWANNSLLVKSGGTLSGGIRVNFLKGIPEKKEELFVDR